MTLDKEFLEAVQLLNDLDYDAEAIAGKLHVSIGDVKAVLRTGCVPKRQRYLAWENAA